MGRNELFPVRTQVDLSLHRFEHRKDAAQLTMQEDDLVGRRGVIDEFREGHGGVSYLGRII